MGCHDVNLLRLTVKLDGLTALFIAAGAGLLVLEWPLCCILFGVLLKYFSPSYIVTGSMQQACFCTGISIYWMACIIFIELASAALLGVGWRGVLSSVKFPTMTGMVGLFPVGIFRSFPSFVYLLRNLHGFKHAAFVLVVPYLKVTAL